MSAALAGVGLRAHQYRDNTMMLLGDAKKMTEGIVKAL